MRSADRQPLLSRKSLPVQEVLKGRQKIYILQKLVPHNPRYQEQHEYTAPFYLQLSSEYFPVMFIVSIPSIHANIPVWSHHVIFLHALFLTAALLPANIIPDVPVQLLQTAVLFLNILFLHKDNAYENGILMGDRPDLGHLPEE